MINLKKSLAIAILMVCVLSLIIPVKAASANEIEAGIDSTLGRFYREVAGGQDLVNRAEGVLIFPSVYKAGLVIGGEYGEGALKIAGSTVDYYSTASGSFGWQLGAQKKSLIILFMDEGALDQFRNSSNWKAGVDASIAVIAVGANGSLDTSKLNKPIIAFVIDQKGLMYNLTLEGSKFTKIKR